MPETTPEHSADPKAAGARTLGVCSWSLRPSSPADLVAALKEIPVGGEPIAVQLALDPILRGAWDERETFDRLADAGIAVRSGMMEMAGEDYSSIDAITRTGGVRPDAAWRANEAAAREIAAIAGRHGVPLVTFHAGFLPHENGDPVRARMLDRLRTLARIFAAEGVRVGLETGQEDARTLLAVLDELDEGGSDAARVGVNFDPANMLLYGSGDPAQTLEALAPRVVQIHIKDAIPSGDPSVWGEEVVSGTGRVDWDAVFATIERTLPTVDLMIEREAGDSRLDDIRSAYVFLTQHLRSGARS